MSLDEAADVGLPCPGPTAAASAAAAAAASGAAGLAVNLTSLVGCNTTLVISTAGPSPSSSTFSAPINFTWQDLTVVAVSCIVIALIVIGNTLVIVAVMTTRRLRTITNCFVMSLAVADWLVGVFVLPPAVAYQLMGTWELGWVLCDLWVSLDVLLCTASILSLCAISVDRYLAVTQPLNYSRRRRSKRLALAMILAVWVVAAAITCPPILGWYEAGRHSNKTCRYNQNEGYVVFSAMGSFFVPLVVMLYVYAKIHCVVARRHDHLSAWDSKQTSRKLRDVTLDVRSPVPCSYSSGSGGQPAGAATQLGQAVDVDVSNSRSGVRRCQKCCRASCAASQIPGQVASLNGNLASQSSRTIAGSGSLGALSTSCLPATPPSNEPADLNHHHHNHHHHHHHQHKRQHTYAGVSAGGPRVSSFRRAESKTAKTLWMLVGGFVACWLPFFVVYIITPFLPHESVSKGLQLGLTWLGWINSAVNPFIYAFYSPDFRVAFWRLTLRHCTPRSKAPGPPDSVRR